MQFCHVDGVAVYRILQNPEEEGGVKSLWNTDTSGPARKWYQITGKGVEMLEEYKEDIEKSKKNLEFFLDSYEHSLQK